MIRASSLISGTLGAALLAAGSGCGGSAAKPVKTDGLVTLDGKPVAGAAVTFHPEGEKGHVATGLTGADGFFRLQTYSTGDGALPGDYKVTVSKTEALASSAPADDPEKQKEWMMKTMFNPQRQKTPASPLPKEYGDVSKTPLRVRVPDEKGQVKLELRRAGGS